MSTPSMAALKTLCANRDADHFALVMGAVVPVLAENGVHGDVLEIGVARGHTHRHLARCVRDANAALDTCIRLWGIEKADPEDRYMVDLNALVDAMYQEGCQPHLLIADSADCMSFAASLRLALLFVDGCHSETMALSDLRTFGPSVIPGGILVVHDVNKEDDHRGSVWRAVLTFIEEHGDLIAEHFHYIPSGHEEGVWIAHRNGVEAGGTA